MSLLSPFFLAGLLLVAGPIIAHLIRRATKDRVEFSALRFLSPSAPRLDRRSRVQNPWLLLLRCLIVALLVLAFARPYWTQTAAPVDSATKPKIVITLLDRSASMQRDGLWDDALERVETVIEQLAPSDVFALIAFDGRTETLVSGEQWQAALPSARPGLVAAVLAGQSPSWNATHLDNAVALALETGRELNETIGGASSTELIVISDLTTGTRITGLAGLDWPTQTVVKLETLSAPADATAFTLQWLGWGADSGQGAPARVRIVGPPPATPQALSLQLVDAQTDQPWGDLIETVMSTTGTQLLAIPVPHTAPESLRIELVNASADIGQSLFVVRALTREVPFKVWGAASAQDTSAARFYLENAVSGWRDPRVILANEATPDSAALHVVAGDLSDAEISTLQSRLEAGAFVVLLANSPRLVTAAHTLAGETSWATGLAASGRALLFGEIDFTHPLFASFADPRFSDFTRIRFNQPTRLELPTDTATQVVARFDDGTPAVLESQVGRGRLIVWATGWSPRESQWVLSTKFVPWLQAVAERAVGGAIPVAVAELGNLERLALTRDTVITGSGASGGSVISLDRPGIYTVTAAEARPRLIALNVPASETQFEPLAWDSFEDLGVPLGSLKLTSDPAPELVGELPESALVSESRQRAWRWFLLAAIALLIVEGIAAMILTRRSGQTTPVTAS
jgi:hypothetical protein